MPALHDNNAKDSHASAATAFPFFTQLPQEIATRIILLACRSKHSTLTPDINTTHALTLVSKPTHALVNALLYKVVRVTRPSSLVELVGTFEERPELGKLVKHLHVGAEDTLVPGDWPLAMETEQDGMQLQYPILWLKTSLSERDKKKLLPRWCEPGKKWCLEGSGRVDCRGAAVRGAIEAALQALDVEPYKKGYARSGGKIGLPEWAVRVFLLQACLDLYLVEMRRIEGIKGYALPEKARPLQDPPICRLGKCSHYPRLVLFQDDATTEQVKVSTGKATLSLTVLQLWRHLTRRGASQDHFNHPIKFASGVDTGYINEHGKRLIMLDLEGPNLGYFEPEDFDPEDDGESESSDAEEDAKAAAKGKGPSCLPYDGGPESQEDGKTTGHRKVTTYTAVGSMVMTSHLLRLTPGLVNLSLKGHLHLGFLMDDLDVMEKLKSLSLGPLLPFWDGGAFSTGWDGPALCNLENLRVAGMMLGEGEAWRIAGKGRGLGELKRFQWEMVSTTHPSRRPRLNVESLYRCIRVLQGQVDTDDLEDLEEEDSKSSEELTSPSAYTESSRLLEIALHPDDVSALLGHASPQLRTAWQIGSRLNDGSAPHRVRLVESEAAKTDPLANRSVAIERLHESARRWWEECGTAEEKSGVRGKEKDWMTNAGRGLEREESGEVAASSKKEKEEKVVGAAIFSFE